jgi:AraC-like DNA-binding protein
VLPRAEMHLVVRLSGPPVRLFDGPDDAHGRSAGHTLIGGPRSGSYLKEAPAGATAVGVQLRPGAAQALFGLPADELAESHIALQDLWGNAAALLREQLLEADSQAHRLRILEAFLSRRLADAPAVDPLVPWALARFASGATVGAAVEQSGYSHRQFIRIFSAAVGLSPKRYLRVRRFQHGLKLLRLPDARLAEVGIAAGYSDQAHFSREFRSFAGLAPEQYRRVAPAWANHLPLP